MSSFSHLEHKETSIQRPPVNNGYKFWIPWVVVTMVWLYRQSWASNHLSKSTTILMSSFPHLEYKKPLNNNHKDFFLFLKHCNSVFNAFGCKEFWMTARLGFKRFFLMEIINLRIQSKLGFKINDWKKKMWLSGVMEKC